jgi:hypothetical protein
MRSGGAYWHCRAALQYEPGKLKFYQSQSSIVVKDHARIARNCSSLNSKESTQSVVPVVRDVYKTGICNWLFIVQHLQ